MAKKSFADKIWQLGSVWCSVLHPIIACEIMLLYSMYVNLITTISFFLATVTAIKSFNFFYIQLQKLLWDSNWGCNIIPLSPYTACWTSIHVYMAISPLWLARPSFLLIPLKFMKNRCCCVPPLLDDRTFLRGIQTWIVTKTNHIAFYMI